MFTTKDYLSFLATPGSHAVRQNASWVIRSVEGRNYEAELGGFAFSPVVIPDGQFADLERARLIASDNEGSWRLTRSAQVVAKAA